MKKIYPLIIVTVAVFCFKAVCYAATVGNSLDLDIPTKSSVLRQQIIEQTLEEYDQTVKIKASIDTEFVFDKNLHTSFEMEGAEIKGQWYMAKFGTTLFNRIEPYIKVGTSNLQVKWKQGTETIDVDADYGFAWGGGVKTKIYEFHNCGIRITGDCQYRTTEPDVADITIGNRGVSDSGADFKIEEWQASIALSKKFEVPLRWQSIYIVPYTGMTVSDSTVDVKVTGPNLVADYSLFDANNESIFGFFLGCDIMPSLLSYYILNFELRLIDETAITLGGTIKF